VDRTPIAFLEPAAIGPGDVVLQHAHRMGWRWAMTCSMLSRTL
jgi:hypothetical protein